MTHSFLRSLVSLPYKGTARDLRSMPPFPCYLRLKTVSGPEWRIMYGSLCGFQLSNCGAFPLRIFLFFSLSLSLSAPFPPFSPSSSRERKYSLTTRKTPSLRQANYTKRLKKNDSPIYPPFWSDHRRQSGADRKRSLQMVFRSDTGRGVGLGLWWEREWSRHPLLRHCATSAGRPAATPYA